MNWKELINPRVQIVTSNEGVIFHLAGLSFFIFLQIFYVGTVVNTIHHAIALFTGFFLYFTTLLIISLVGQYLNDGQSQKSLEVEK